MAVFLKTPTKIACRFLILCTLFGCSPQDKNPRYYEGREFVFQVESLKDSSILRTDTITLRIKNTLSTTIMFGGGQTGIQWIYKTVRDSASGKPVTETTGVIDDSTEVSIHPPRFGFMAFTEIPPFPDINLPPDTASTSQVELYGIKGHGNLDGKTITKTFKVVGQTNLTLFDKTYPDVWVSKGKNTNHLKELGQYRVTYWFDKSLGFLRIRYEKPGGGIVDMKLKRTKLQNEP